jgi:hypothetical protein
MQRLVVVVVVVIVIVEWGVDPGPCSPDAPRPYEQALCALLLVSPVISRGAPRLAT